MRDELDVADLVVTEGALPPQLNGQLVRMAPNPVLPVPDDHQWFAGIGMVHGISLKAGKPNRFINRWVRTPAASAALGESSELQPNGTSDLANTSAFMVNDRLLGLTETCQPYELDRDLKTVGRVDFGANITNFTAHPHRDPVTGQTLAVGYDLSDRPECSLYVIGRDGAILSTTTIELLGARSVHDFAFTKNYVVIWDLPLAIDGEQREAGSLVPVRWDEQGAARVGVLDRRNLASAARWFSIDPCWVFHPVNAFETDTGITLHVCKFRRVFHKDTSGPGDPYPPQLWKWELPRNATKVVSSMIDPRVQEYARIDSRFWAAPHRYGYTIELFSRNASVSLIGYDFTSGSSSSWSAEPGHTLSEAIFVEDGPHASEGEGWLLAIDSTTTQSDLVVFDATRISTGPIARVPLPQRIPDGFHGEWIPTPVE